LSRHTATRGYIAVDLGKTNCRLRLATDASSVEVHGPGFPGLATAGGADLALAAIGPLLSSLEPRDRADVGQISIGAAGADSDRESAHRMALEVRERWGFDVTVASDVLTAHVGAFEGGAGTVLIAGTGAVAFHVGSDGHTARSDGWGPWLGDEGSGRWIGQMGVIAALRSADGRGPRTSLEDDARTLAGEIRDLPRVLTGGGDVARSLAAFAPRVLSRARAGDEVASELVDRAVRHLALTVASITGPDAPVSVIGGLTGDPDFLTRLLDELAHRGLTRRRPSGTSLDGALLLAARRDLPHERYAIRV